MCLTLFLPFKFAIQISGVVDYSETIVESFICLHTHTHTQNVLCEHFPMRIHSLAHLGINAGKKKL